MAKINIKGYCYTCSNGIELLHAYKMNPLIPLKFGCTKGSCGTCKIKVIQGAENLSKRTKQEIETIKAKNLDESYRLACQCAIHGDIVIE